MDGRILLLVYILAVSSSSSSGCDIPNNRCINGVCHLNNAKPHCTHGCQDGYAGGFCNEMCSYQCNACLRDHLHQCTVCPKGKFGQQCNQRCSYCLNDNCYINGTCTEGCKTGSSCDANCHSNCDNELSTEKHRNDETTTGNSNTCPPNCKTCTSPGCSTCNYSTTQCLHGCEDGYTGYDCNIQETQGIQLTKGSHDTQDARDTGCPLHCTECSNNAACLICQEGYSGENCTLCTQNAAGCESSSSISSSISSIPAQPIMEEDRDDIWNQIVQKFRDNELLLPLVCCGLVLVVVVIAVVIWRCRVQKGQQIVNMDSNSDAEPQEVIFANCGDIYHEIDDTQLDRRHPSRPKPPPRADYRPPQPLPLLPGQGNRGQGRRGRPRRGQGQRFQGRQHHEGQGHTHNGFQGQGPQGGQTNSLKDHVSHLKEPLLKNELVSSSDATENESYISPILEVSQSPENRPSLLITPLQTQSLIDGPPASFIPDQEARETGELVMESCSHKDPAGTQDLLVGAKCGHGSYMTAIPETENQSLFPGGVDSSIRDTNGSNQGMSASERQFLSEDVDEQSAAANNMIRYCDTEEINLMSQGQVSQILQCPRTSKTEVCDVTKRYDQSQFLPLNEQSSLRPIYPDNLSFPSGLTDLDNDLLDESGYLLPRKKLQSSV